MNTAINRDTVKKAVITIVLVVAVLSAYSYLTESGLPRISLIALLLSTLVLLSGWLVSALRLRYLVGAYHGSTCSLRTCISARFVGDVFAKITPSSIGGEAARAHYLSTAMGLDFLEAYALTIYEVYFDVILTCLVGAVVSVIFLPYSTPVLVTAVATGLIWVTTFNFIGRLVGFFNRKLLNNEYLEKSFMTKYLVKFLAYVKKFKDSYLEVSSKITPRQRAVLWALTLLTHTLWALALIPLLLLGGVVENPDVRGIFWKSVAAYYLMQAISILPTPGGSGVAEYGLSLALPPSVVVSYRVVYFFVPFFIGLAVFLKYSRR